MIQTGAVLPRRLLFTAALVAAIAAACSSEDGRALPAPRPDQTTTTTSSAPPPSEGEPGVIEVFSLSSEAFTGGGEIPAEHTCAGAGTSPALAWASTPPAAELALVVRDPGSDGAVHWIVTGIDPLVQGVAAGGVPEGATPHENGFGEVGWHAPCPSEGETLTLELAIYALPEPVAVEPGTTPDEVVAQVEQTASEVAVLTGTATG